MDVRKPWSSRRGSIAGTGMEDAHLAALMVELRMRHMRELVGAMQRGSEVC
jgi:hypothetical protein